MKKMILVSMVATVLLVNGCSEEKKEVAKAVEQTQTVSQPTVAVKKEEPKVQSEEKNLTTKTEANTTKAVVDTNKTIVEQNTTGTTEANTTESNATEKSANNEAVVALFAKCTACHGAKGEIKAMGKSEIIAGQKASDLEAKIKEYKVGTRNVSGMGGIMKTQVVGLDDAQIKAVAGYISTLK